MYKTKYKIKCKIKYRYSGYTEPLKVTTRAKSTFDVGYGLKRHYEIVDQLYNGNNIAVSEQSLNLALGMLANGASGNSLTQLENYLGKDLQNINDFARAETHYYNDLKKAKFLIANSLWLNKNSFTLNNDYAQSIKASYDPETQALDFGDPASADIINDWCDKKTNGLIPNIINADALGDLEMAIINSLYFKSSWANGYEDYHVKKEDFNNMNGVKSSVKMLHSTENSYLENEYATGAMKAYNDDIYFVGILPKKKGEFNISDMDIEGLLNSETNSVETSLTIPEFDISSDMDLQDYFVSSGVTDIFSSEDADLKKIGSTASKTNLFVSLIKQKTHVKLDRKGTEAAAVTIIGEKATAVPGMEEKRKIVTLDRPFAFLIYDKANDVVLFEGKIVNLQ